MSKGESTRQLKNKLGTGATGDGSGVRDRQSTEYKMIITRTHYGVAYDRYPKTADIKSLRYKYVLHNMRSVNIV